MRTLLKKSEVDLFEKQYNALIKAKRGEALIGGFTSLLKDFMKGAAQTAGGIVATAYIPLPLIAAKVPNLMLLIKVYPHSLSPNSYDLTY